jgi:hypothetical protein
MTTSFKKVGLLAAAFLAAACAGEGDFLESVDSVALPAKCGPTWDLQDVELYDGSDPVYDEEFVARRQGPVGRHCSGTMISHDLFLTVEHDGCPVEVGESVGFNCQLSANDPDPPDPDAAAAARCVWYEATSVAHYGGSIDISVSRLEGGPGGTYGWTLPSVRIPAVDEHLAIIQHPGAFGRRKMVGFGPVVEIDGKDLRHGVDTSGGSSGSGVLDRNGLLVGVHRASGCTQSGGSNAATLMEYVVDNVPEVRTIMAAIWTASAG